MEHKLYVLNTFLIDFILCIPIRVTYSVTKNVKRKLLDIYGKIVEYSIEGNIGFFIESVSERCFLECSIFLFVSIVLLVCSSVTSVAVGFIFSLVVLKETVLYYSLYLPDVVPFTESFEN